MSSKTWHYYKVQGSGLIILQFAALVTHDLAVHAEHVRSKRGARAERTQRTRGACAERTRRTRGANFFTRASVLHGFRTGQSFARMLIARLNCHPRWRCTSHYRRWRCTSRYPRWRCASCYPRWRCASRDP